MKKFSCFALLFSLLSISSFSNAWSHKLDIHNQSHITGSKVNVTVFPSIGSASPRSAVLDNDEIQMLSFTESSSYGGCPHGLIGVHCDKGEIHLEFWQAGNILSYSNCTVKYEGEPQGNKFVTFVTKGDSLACRHFTLSHNCPTGRFNCISVND